MLVLTRSRSEVIVLDCSRLTAADLLELQKQPIAITVVDIRGDKVRLGTNALKCVAVHRQEVYEQIHQEKSHA